MRFIFIADSHVGAGVEGYRKQPRYADHLSELAARLDAWIRRAGDIDFVLHGGDMVDAATPENIRAAREIFRLSVPVYLCLGNHDLTGDNAVDTWFAEAPGFFPDGSPLFSIRGREAVIHVLPVQWWEVPYSWREKQEPHFLPGHLEQVGAAIAGFPRVPHILCVHAAAMGIPAEQTGLAAVTHAPPESFTETMATFTRRWTTVRCVLAGHNHINSHLVREGAHWVTVSAFAETPFEFKVVDVTEDSMTMVTENLGADVMFAAHYDFNQTYVQGRQRDRAFELSLDGGDG